jgi:hypothetical protein
MTFVISLRDMAMPGESLRGRPSVAPDSTAGPKTKGGFFG